MRRQRGLHPRRVDTRYAALSADDYYDHGAHVDDQRDVGIDHIDDDAGTAMCPAP